VRITVADTGIGIAPADQRRLFQPFQQLDSSLARKYKGTGLGLAITDQIIALHGGSISHETQNGLTVFTLRFPAIGQDPEGIPAAHSHDGGEEKPPPSGGEDLSPSQTTSSS